MEERRRDKRLPLDVAIEISRISEGDITTVSYVHVNVTDMSRSGIGFSSERELENETFYDTKIRIWTGEIIYVVLEILRVEKRADEYHYGAKFIGISEAEALKIEIYRMFQEKKE